MSQDQVIVLLFRIITIADVAAIAAFIACYTRWAPWWRNPIGRTLVIKDILLVLILVPSIMSLFFQFNRLTSHIAAWADIALLGLLVPVMAWRIAVFGRIHQQGDDKAAANRETRTGKGAPDDR